jgi:hydroxyacylglutathione hydrolase
MMARAEASEMIIRCEVAPPFYKNGYVLGCERTREAVLIDPGDEVEALIDAVRADGLTVRHILLTHAHLDHITGVGRAKRAFSAPIHLHSADVPLYEAVVYQGQMFGLAAEPQPAIDVFFDRVPRTAFGDYLVEAFHTPGHCPGGVCLAVTTPHQAVPDLFVGDTLFAGSIGRTDLPGGDYATLVRSIRDVLFAFPDEATVRSGHGEETTIGREKRTNPFLNPMPSV